MKQQLTFFSFLSLLMFGIGFVAGRWITDPVSVSEIKYVDRYLPKFSNKYSLPTSKLVYLPMPVEKLRRDTVYIPKEIVKYVITDASKGIKIKPRSVAFSYYDPSTNRYNTDTYNIPQKNFYFTAGVDGVYTPTLKAFYGSVWGGFVIKKTTFMVGYATQTNLNYPFFGVRYTFFD